MNSKEAAMLTADQMALSVLLDNRPRKQARLSRLAAAARRALENRFACPDCGDEGPHDDNGDRRDFTLCCASCGTHFNPGTVA